MNQQKIKLKPYTLVVRTTERCYVGCSHCSISATAKGNDLPLQLGLDAIEAAKKSGLNRVHFTGGEPLLYENLPLLIEHVKQLQMTCDATTSTFTKKGLDTIRILDKLSTNGLDCIMLSYDEPHSKSVSLDHFLSFVKAAVKMNIHIYVFVTQGGEFKFQIEDLKQIFLSEGIEADKMEWTVSEYQFEGRGKKRVEQLELVSEKVQSSYCRCPYVMAVPTLNPNGDVLLCHMSRFKTENFVVGKYPEEPFEEILDRMENNPIYRYLSKYGPQQSLINIGFNEEEVPNDMCGACEKYLTVMESKIKQNELDELVRFDDLSNIEVDYEGVLPIYQRYLSEFGEKINKTTEK